MIAADSFGKRTMKVPPSSPPCLLSLLTILLSAPFQSWAFCPNTNPIHNRFSSSTTPVTTPTSKTRLQLWSEVLPAIEGFYHAAPYAAGGLVCGIKASAADFVAQKRQLDKFQLARNVAFLLYGALYQGVAQEYVYNHCYDVWFGVANSPTVVLKKVLFDLLVQTTVVTLPMAYLTKAAIFRYSFVEGLRRYKNDVLNHGLLTKYFKLWGPVQCLTFGVVPQHLRISFIAAVSFFWLIILSTVSGRSHAPSKEEPANVFVAEEIEAVVDSEARLVTNTTAFATSG